MPIVEVIIVTALDATVRMGFGYDDLTLRVLSIGGTNNSGRAIDVEAKKAGQSRGLRVNAVRTSRLDVANLNWFLVPDIDGVFILPFSFSCGSA